MMLSKPTLSYVFMSILAAERQQQILERLGRDGRVLATSLAEIFATSEERFARPRDLAGEPAAASMAARCHSHGLESAQIRTGEAADRKAAWARHKQPHPLTLLGGPVDKPRGGEGFSRPSSAHSGDA